MVKIVLSGRDVGQQIEDGGAFVLGENDVSRLQTLHEILGSFTGNIRDGRVKEVAAVLDQLLHTKTLGDFRSLFGDGGSQRVNSGAESLPHQSARHRTYATTEQGFGVKISSAHQP